MPQGNCEVMLVVNTKTVDMGKEIWVGNHIEAVVTSGANTL